MHALKGRSPDWLVCAEFLSTMLKRWSGPQKPKTQEELIECILKDILVDGDPEITSDDISEDKRFSQIADNLDSEHWRSVQFLSQVIADCILFGNGTNALIGNPLSKMLQGIEKSS